MAKVSIIVPIYGVEIREYAARELKLEFNQHLGTLSAEQFVGYQPIDYHLIRKLRLTIKTPEECLSESRLACTVLAQDNRNILAVLAICKSNLLVAELTEVFEFNRL